MQGPGAARDEVVEPGGFGAEGFRAMDIGGFGAQRDEGFMLSHGVSKPAPRRGFGGRAEFEGADRFAERPGQLFPVSCSASELVNRPGRGANIQGRIQSGCGRADLRLFLLPILNGLGQAVLCNLYRSFAELEDRCEFESER